MPWSANSSERRILPQIFLKQKNSNLTYLIVYMRLWAKKGQVCSILHKSKMFPQK